MKNHLVIAASDSTFLIVGTCYITLFTRNTIISQSTLLLQLNEIIAPTFVMFRFGISHAIFLLLSTLGNHAAASKSIGAMEEETGFYQSITVTDESPLLTKRSKYQTIQVQESNYYGKILVLVGLIGFVSNLLWNRNYFCFWPANLTHYFASTPIPILRRTGSHNLRKRMQTRTMK
jgi:hypothetical protein